MDDNANRNSQYRIMRGNMFHSSGLYLRVLCMCALEHKKIA